MKNLLTSILSIFPPLVFSQSLHCFHENGKWGFTNTMQEVVIQPIYEGAVQSYVDCYPVKTGGKWGAINEKGILVLPATYDTIGPFSAMGKKLVAEAKLGGKYGIIRNNGDVIVDFRYDFIGEFDEYGFMAYSDNDLCGVCDLKGNIIIPFDYEFVSYSYDELLPAAKDTLWGVINRNNQVIVPFQFSDTWIGYRFIEVYLNEKYGFWTMDGKKLTDPIYESYDDSFDEIMLVQQNEKWGILNSDYSTLLACDFDEIYDFHYWDKENIIITKNEKMGIFNVESGKILLEPKYDAIDMDETRFYYCVSGELVGLFDYQTSSLLFEPKYNSVEWVGVDDFYYVTTGDSSGIMRSDGSLVIQPVYEYVEVEKKKFLAWKGDMVTTYDLDGNLITK